MKKHILLLFALICSVMGIYAMNLKDAYNALSNLPGITAELNDTIHVSVNKNAVDNGIMKVAGAHGLNSADRNGRKRHIFDSESDPTIIHDQWRK